MTQWIALVLSGLVTVVFAGAARAEEAEIVYDTPAALQQAFQQGRQQLASGDYYTAAANFFNIYTARGELQDAALSSLTESLIRGGYPNAAAYFYIKTLQSGNRAAIRKVVAYLPQMMDAVGVDLLRKYIVRATSEADYDNNTKNHFYYLAGKEDLLKGDAAHALQHLNKVGSGSGIVAQAAYLRGAAYATIGQPQNALAAFQSCRRLSSGRSGTVKGEGQDLEARCTASVARTYYEMGEYVKAEETFDDIPKSSFVWTDILFEQAWNAYAKGDYNRALGKLVTYRSPSLNFVFNPEVDVLRAQSFFAMCIYDDVAKTAREFKSRYAGVGGQIKSFLLSHDRDLGSYYALAKQTYYRKLHTEDMLSKALNRFVRGPYFAHLIAQERATQHEASRVHAIAARQGHPRFSSFLEKVIGWRAKTVRLIGGAFVRNSMDDLYSDLLANLDKMSFIELETLNHTKLKLERKQVMSEDEDGVLKRGKSDIERRDYQYFWTFNGEFWADELGDYVFALEPQCGS
jgi:hypothetical protein